MSRAVEDLVCDLWILLFYSAKLFVRISLVDKIIISQESLGRFMNSLYPGSYSSMTRINFAVLDTLTLKPRGIYGSRSEIVRFLRDVDAVNDTT